METPENKPPSAAAYNVGNDTAASLAIWKRGEIRPDVFVIAPFVRDVGEGALIRELADASYQLQGFRDSPQRHFISRSFPYGATEARYARFADEAFDASEITDDFFGVDAIDLSEWLGHDLRESMVDWRRLIEYVCDHPETDFVFVVYTDDASSATALARSIMEGCGIALERVQLGYPKAEALANAFDKASGGAFAQQRTDIVGHFEQMQASGKALNFAFATSCGYAVIHALGVCGNADQALRETFERYARMSPVPVRKRTVGF